MDAAQIEDVTNARPPLASPLLRYFPINPLAACVTVSKNAWMSGVGSPHQSTPFVQFCGVGPEQAIVDKRVINILCLQEGLWVTFWARKSTHSLFTGGRDVCRSSFLSRCIRKC